MTKVELLEIDQEVDKSVVKIVAQLEESIAANDPVRRHPLIGGRLDDAFDNLYASKDILGQWDPSVWCRVAIVCNVGPSFQLLLQDRCHHRVLVKMLLDHCMQDQVERLVFRKLVGSHLKFAGRRRTMGQVSDHLSIVFGKSWKE